jgi:hypothetical protein
MIRTRMALLVAAALAVASFVGSVNSGLWPP